jgi:hypothetical protein
MTRKTPGWLRGRRDACEERLSFLIAEFGYRRSLRRFRWGGFQLGYLGPGAGALVEWYPRDGVIVWLLPLSPGEVPANWGGAGGPKGFDLGFVAVAAGSQLEVREEDMYGATDEALTALASALRSSGQRMLRGDYAQVPVIEDLIRARAEALRKGHLSSSPGQECAPSAIANKELAGQRSARAVKPQMWPNSGAHRRALRPADHV